jgi:hypothetical protein
MMMRVGAVGVGVRLCWESVLFDPAVSLLFRCGAASLFCFVCFF